MKKYRRQRNYGCRIHDQYTYFGMRTIVLENDLVRISLLLDKGTEIFEYLYKPSDLDFMWLTENGVQNPTDYLPTSPDPVSTFIDYYPGGWQEVFPNGGGASTYKGAQMGQHGEVAHMAWDYEIVEDTPERISVCLGVRTKKTPFQLSKTLTLTRNSPSLTIEETLENVSGEPQQYMWGQHLAFGRPFLEAGCTIIMPEGLNILTENADSPVALPGTITRGTSNVWPNGVNDRGETVDLSRIPEVGTLSDIVYLHGFPKEAWYKVENDLLGMGMKVQWDGEAFPYLWFWQEYGATKDYPWYGRHYNIGLEPFSSYPTFGLEEAIRNGSAGCIGPRERKTFTMQTTPYPINQS
ncbi:aldose 1-epimerase [Cohnella silvisoli]|uniref:Aldose 1-epimerase n=1 Tax=Cohnella silvisoli TaxID=2873699 RepID=A0ABV1KW56_9BACL|nr:aldose 1-epimerase [Cohnella silvisoli]MCD9023629.1 aldose 1-epimerase [Cohnella silvisoli]